MSVAVYEKGQPVIGVIYDPIKDELFHALKGQGAYLNDAELKPLEDTSVKHSLIGINSLWLIPNEYCDYTKFHSLIRDLRGTRIIGSAALEMAAVACGRLDGFICLRLSPWD
ncbi:Inositol-1-monophosphatase [Paenibacillus konkukensis]|uniref:Inositol-1-monophosphatase n=1 Tax=Paenibacillus konkukensis TaxID=2020716 RepID=A0ABY4RQ42_9BACL|nr:Inositol-1-monophosphatase [Paenibacillus konkukensis]